MVKKITFILAIIIIIETIEQCDEAFDSLMTRMGTEGESITWGEERTAMKTTPFIYLKSEQYIVFCKLHCEHKNQFWDEFKQLVEKEFKTEKYKIITAGCGGPLQFKTNEE